jgi:hypothetical protein
MTERADNPPPVTPDGRYIIVRGRLWRTANPNLSPVQRESLVAELMSARRAVKSALATGDETELRRARGRVQQAKEALGERGPAWWNDGAPDFSRRMARNTPYAEWWVSRCRE